MGVFNIWNTPNAYWLQNSMRGEYCRNGRGVTLIPVVYSGLCQYVVYNDRVDMAIQVGWAGEDYFGLKI